MRSATLSLDGPGPPAGRAERKDGDAVPTPAGRGAVRADLEDVFRTAYGRVVAVAAAHTALNHLRSGRRRTSREEAAGAAEAVAPDTADTVVTRDERRRVRQALARLPHRQAVALVLRHSGLSYAEVAAALDLSPGSVGTTVRRAEATLRKELNRNASSD